MSDIIALAAFAMTSMTFVTTPTIAWNAFSITCNIGLRAANAFFKAVIAWSFFLKLSTSFITTMAIALMIATIGIFIRDHSCVANDFMPAMPLLNAFPRLPTAFAACVSPLTTEVAAVAAFVSAEAIFFAASAAARSAAPKPSTVVVPDAALSPRSLNDCAAFSTTVVASCVSFAVSVTAFPIACTFVEASLLSFPTSRRNPVIVLVAVTAFPNRLSPNTD